MLCRMSYSFVQSISGAGFESLYCVLCLDCDKNGNRVYAHRTVLLIANDWINHTASAYTKSLENEIKKVRLNQIIISISRCEKCFLGSGVYLRRVRQLAFGRVGLVRISTSENV